jgi:hypothetical protein
MGRRARDRRHDARGRSTPAPIPVQPVDLLAGLAPGVELAADAPETLDPESGPATTTVDAMGKLVRGGEGTVRRLIRSGTLSPGAATDAAPPDRAGVLPPDPDRPGE